MNEQNELIFMYKYKLELLKKAKINQHNRTKSLLDELHILKLTTDTELQKTMDDQINDLLEKYPDNYTFNIKNFIDKTPKLKKSHM